MNRLVCLTEWGTNKAITLYVAFIASVVADSNWMAGGPSWVVDVNENRYHVKETVDMIQAKMKGIGDET